MDSKQTLKMKDVLRVETWRTKFDKDGGNLLPFAAPEGEVGQSSEDEISLPELEAESTSQAAGKLVWTIENDEQAPVCYAGEPQKPETKINKKCRTCKKKFESYSDLLVRSVQTSAEKNSFVLEKQKQFNSKIFNPLVVPGAPHERTLWRTSRDVVRSFMPYGVVHQQGPDGKEGILQARILMLWKKIQMSKIRWL